MHSVLPGLDAHPLGEPDQADRASLPGRASVHRGTGRDDGARRIPGPAECQGQPVEAGPLGVVGSLDGQPREPHRDLRRP